MKKIVTLIAAALCLVSCGDGTTKEGWTEVPKNKTLEIYLCNQLVYCGGTSDLVTTFYKIEVRAKAEIKEKVNSNDKEYTASFYGDIGYIIR